MSRIKLKDIVGKALKKSMEKKSLIFLKRMIAFTVTFCFIPVTISYGEELSKTENQENATEYVQITVDSSNVINEKISKLIFGVNAASYTPDNLSPEVQKYLSEWAEIIRWPSGANTDMYDWYTHTRSNYDKNTIADLDKATLTSNFVDFTKKVGDGAEILVGVNSALGFLEQKEPVKPVLELLKERYPEGLPKGSEHAANWVKYANKDFTNKYGQNEPHKESLNIKYWEIGNEANLLQKREFGMTNDEIKSSYNELFREYFLKMTEVDPDIKVMGPVSTENGFAEIKDAEGNVTDKSVMESFLENNGDIVDMVSFHWYQRTPEGYKSLQESLMHRVDEYGDRIRKVREWINKYGVDTERRKKEDIKIALTEYNAGPGTDTENKIWGHAVWTADMLGMFMRENLYMANIWHIKMGTHSLYNVDAENNTVTPYPAHYALKFMHDHSYVNEGSRLVKGESTNPSLRVYPVEHGNKLSLIVINTSDKEDITAKINLDKKVGNIAIDYELAKVGDEVQKTVEISGTEYERTFKSHTITALEFNYQLDSGVEENDTDIKKLSLMDLVRIFLTKYFYVPKQYYGEE